MEYHVYLPHDTSVLALYDQLGSVIVDQTTTVVYTGNYKLPRNDVKSRSFMIIRLILAEA